MSFLVHKIYDHYDSFCFRMAFSHHMNFSRRMFFLHYTTFFHCTFSFHHMVCDLRYRKFCFGMFFCPHWCYLLHRAYGLHIFFFLNKAFYPVLNDHGYQSHDLCDKAYEQMAFWRHYFYVCREVPVFWHLLHVSGLLQ